MPLVPTVQKTATEKQPLLEWYYQEWSRAMGRCTVLTVILKPFLVSSLGQLMVLLQFVRGRLCHWIQDKVQVEKDQTNSLGHRQQLPVDHAQLVPISLKRRCWIPSYSMMWFNTKEAYSRQGWRRGVKDNNRVCISQCMNMMLHGLVASVNSFKMVEDSL